MLRQRVNRASRSAWSRIGWVSVTNPSAAYSSRRRRSVEYCLRTGTAEGRESNQSVGPRGRGERPSGPANGGAALTGARCPASIIHSIIGRDAGAGAEVEEGAEGAVDGRGPVGRVLHPDPARSEGEGPTQTRFDTC